MHYSYRQNSFKDTLLRFGAKLEVLSYINFYGPSFVEFEREGGGWRGESISLHSKPVIYPAAAAECGCSIIYGHQLEK